MRPRRIPQRTCVGCGQTDQKRQLVRLVRTPEGEVVIDPTGKRNGRGAYVCRQAACLLQLRKGTRLEQALRTTLTPEAKEALFGELATLVGDAP